MTTTFKTPTDFRKSLEARLKKIAEKTNRDLQRIRRKVAFERLYQSLSYQTLREVYLSKQDLPRPLEGGKELLMEL